LPFPKIKIKIKIDKYKYILHPTAVISSKWTCQQITILIPSASNSILARIGGRCNLTSKTLPTIILYRAFKEIPATIRILVISIPRSDDEVVSADFWTCAVCEEIPADILFLLDDNAMFKCKGLGVV
jgi:hypothetical protein